MDEQIDQQVNRLKISVEHVMNGDLNLSRESLDIEVDNLCLKLPSSNLRSMSILSEGRYLNDNQLLDEIEILAYSYDTALMALEDYRSHELRRECSLKSQPAFQLKEVMKQKLKKKQKIKIDDELGNLAPAKEKFIKSYAKNTEGKNKELKKNLDRYNECIKKKKIQLFKDIEDIEVQKQRFTEEKMAFADKKEDFECNVNVIKNTLKQFSDHLTLFQIRSDNEEDVKAEPEDSPESLQQMISSIEKSMCSSNGKVKEKLQVQLNRLKTRLANLRSEAVLTSCQSEKSYNGRRSTSKKSFRNPIRFSSPVLAKKPVLNLKGNTDCNHELIMREVSIIKTRLLGKQEELRERELEFIDKEKLNYSGSLYKEEEKLFRQQEDLDRQKLMFAKRVATFDAFEEEFYKKQQEINDYTKMIRNEVQEFLSLIV